MAKKNEKTGYNRIGFVIAGVALALIMIMNMILLYLNYASAMRTFMTISSESRLINSANGQLQGINEQVMEIVADVGTVNAHVNQITAMVPSMHEKLDAYEQLMSHNDLALRRFHHARAYTNAYINKLKEYNEKMNDVLKTGNEEEIAAFKGSLNDIYEQEVSPLQAAASEMMVASMSIDTALANKRTGQLTRNMNLMLTILGFVLLIGEIAIFLAARYNKHANEEISRKSAQFADASSKLVRSREKMEDIAVTNILTGLKNRYALEQDIGDKLASEQFNLAVFDLDNFRSINDTYGYDFGDEYLAQLSERLKSEFAQFADIYNITGNEFCFVFKRTVSDTQAIRLVDNIVSVMTSPYTILNLTVQLTVSGSTYHYTAGDCLNVNSLLVKMDNVMRNAKRSGGGQIFQVVNI